MVALGASHTKQTFLEEGVFSVPEGKGKAQALVVIADTS
jgi:hypothetical protein